MKKKAAFPAVLTALALLFGMAVPGATPVSLTAKAASADYLVLDDCDANLHFTWQLDGEEKMQGRASMRTGVSVAGDNILNNSSNFALSVPDNLAEMYLEFWFYVGNPSGINATKTSVELFQSGADFYSWNYRAVGTLKKGWNKILLPISSASLKGTVTRINQVRININALKSNGVFRIDDVVLTAKPTADDKTALEAAVALAEAVPSATLDSASPGLKTALEEALAHARALLEDPAATQRDTDQAEQRLTDAVNAFGFDGFTQDQEAAYSYVDVAEMTYSLTDGYGVEDGDKTGELEGHRAAGFTGSLLISPAARYVEGQTDLRFTLRYYDGEKGGLEVYYTGEKGNALALKVEFTGAGFWRSATVRVRDAALARAFGGYDLKVAATGGATVYVDRFEVRTVSPEDPSETDPPEFAPQTEQNNIIGASSIGYQMWFSATDENRGWNAWSPGTRPGPAKGSLTFDGYPYMQDYPDNGAVLYDTDLGELGGGGKAKLFSSRERPVVETHFQWIAEYGIDCMAVQRFGGDYTKRYTEEDNHLCLVRDMAEKYHKTFYVMYDVTGQGDKDSDTFFRQITEDVVYNIEGCGVSTSPVYAHAHGKPVICIWGITGNEEQYDPYVQGYTASRVINWLKSRGYFVIIGTPDNDYADREGEWLEPFTLADMISPWAVGRFNYTGGSIAWLRQHLAVDLAFCEKYGSEYQPVIFPGFSWTNMLHVGKPNEFPRMAGAFVWQQVLQCVYAGAGSLYFAMFDEYNEGTAWMKGARDYFDIPTCQYFVTYAADGTWLSEDYYLRLAGHITRYLKGEITDDGLTIPHSRGPLYWRNSFERRWTTYLATEEEQHTVLCQIDVGAPLSILLDNKGVDLKVMEDTALPDYVSADGDSLPETYAVKREGTGVFRDTSGTYVKSGEWAFLLDLEASASASRASYIFAGCDIMVSTAGLQLSYSLYAETDPGQNAYVDLFLEDGTSLSVRAPELAAARGVRGSWVDVSVDLPASLAGQRIRYIGVSWKGGAGSVKAVVDDIVLQSPGNARTILRTAIATASGMRESEALTAALTAAAAVQNSSSASDKQRLQAARAIDDAVREMPFAGADMPGDVDGDGNITSTDARLVLQLAVDKITESDLPVPGAADVDGDGSITSTDARLILQKSVGKIDGFPAP